jgi:hypothetical protein
VPIGVRSGRLDCDHHAERPRRSDEPEGDRRRLRSGSDDSGSDQCFQQFTGVTDEFHDDLHAAGPVEQVDDAGHDRVCLVAGDDEVTFGHLVGVGGMGWYGPDAKHLVRPLFASSVQVAKSGRNDFPS